MTFKYFWALSYQTLENSISLHLVRHNFVFDFMIGFSLIFMKIFENQFEFFFSNDPHPTESYLDSIPLVFYIGSTPPEIHIFRI